MASAASVPAAAGERAAGRDRAVAAGQSISFAELVWAHFLRQREVLDHGELDGPAEREFRRRLELFELEHGRIVNAYWCTDQASAAALTAKPGRRVLRLWHAHPTLRLHAVTDWSTEDAPEIAGLLHLCETLAVRVGEVLRGTSERIALGWILAAVSYLLGFVDSTKRRRPERLTKEAVRATLAELSRIEAYYDRAGGKVARILYAEGMLAGLAVLAAAVAAGAAVVDRLAGLDLHSTVTQTVLLTLGMGAAGALVSVMSRMASGREGSFNLDYEVGRPLLRFLGGVRPFVGALFALALYLALLGNLLQVEPPSGHKTAFYAALAFVAGFSERSAKVLLGGAERVLGPRTEEAAERMPQPPPHAPPAEPESG